MNGLEIMMIINSYHNKKQKRQKTTKKTKKRQKTQQNKETFGFFCFMKVCSGFSDNLKIL